MQLGQFDWGGLATNIGKAAITYTQARSETKVAIARAQAEAKQILAAQQSMLQAQRPPPMYPPAPAQAAQYSSVPAAQYYRPGYAEVPAPLPTWLIPAGIAAAVGLLVMMRPGGR